MTTLRRDDRWNAGLVGTLALVGLGLAYADPTLVAAAVIPLAYVLYGAFSSLPPTVDLDLRRTFDPAAPAPGERVAVTLAVENAGDRTLADVRVVDGVPAALAVESGSPRAGLSLAPGDAETLTYEVVASRGDFAFDDARLRLRSAAGTSVVTDEVPVAGDELLSCAGDRPDAAAGTAAADRVGTVPADAGGSGLEFHSTREYRPGDPLSRVDWRHLAKTGDLTTVEFREERASRVALVADVRPPARVVAGPGHPTAAELCAYAAARAHGALTAADHEVTATALGLAPEDAPDGVAVGPDGLPWPDGPRAAEATLDAAGVAAAGAARAAARTAGDETFDGDGTFDGEGVFGGEGAFDGAGGAGGDDARDGRGGSRAEDVAATLDARLASDARIVLCSPLLDDDPASLARALRRRGRSVAVLSPDATSAETPGLALASLERSRRRAGLERLGVTVADWTPARPLDAPLSEVLAGG